MGESQESRESVRPVTLRAMVLGIFLSAAFAVVSVWFENRREIFVTSTQIAILPYILLLGLVLLINPVCRLIRVVRWFSAAEILTVFVMCSVSAGVSSYGLASYLVPTIGHFVNRDLRQSDRLDLYVEATLKDEFFLAEPGLTEAARELRAVEIPLRQAERLQRAAMALVAAEEDVRRAEAEVAVGEKITDTDERTAARRAAAYGLTTAQLTLRNVRREWEACGSADDPQAVPAMVGPRIAELREKTLRCRAALREAEDRAAEKAELFQKGLPATMRSVPGFIPMPGESPAEYVRRARRLTNGVSALGRLRRAKVAADAAGESLTEERAAQLDAAVGAAVERLRTIADTTPLDEAEREVKAQQAADEEEGKALLAELKELQQRRREGTLQEAEGLQKQINELKEKIGKVSARGPVHTTRLKEIDGYREPVACAQAAIGQLEGIRAELQQKPPPSGTSVGEEIGGVMEEFPTFDASLQRFIAGEVPWSDWAGPLLNWSVSIVLTFVVLMTLNILVFRQWAHNEKLMYPLAALPEALAGEGEGVEGWVPAVFRSSLFWVGFAIAGGVMGWNLFCAAKGGDFRPIPLVYYWRDYTAGTILDAISEAKMQVMFTLVGIAFMIPPRISFSLWFFFVVVLVQLLARNWMGYPPVGVDPFWYDFSFLTAQGAGGLIVFAAVVVWKCRRYLFCGFRPELVGDLAEADRRELRWASLLFVGASAGLVLSLWLQMGAGLWYTVIFVLLMLALTVSVTRAIAEGGLFSFRLWANPFHYIKTFFGLGNSGAVPGGTAPLFAFYSLLFLDSRTLVSPAIANSLKIREDCGIGRLRFYALIAGSIAIAAVVGVLVYLMLAYDKGVVNMHPMQFMPRFTFGRISALDSHPAAPDPAMAWWLVVGMTFMALLMFGRRVFLWLPHPIGFMMLANQQMVVQWFSIFAGWVVRSLVNRYGSKDTYVRTRSFFIGLIVGELLVIVLSMVLAQSGVYLGAGKPGYNL